MSLLQHTEASHVRATVTRRPTADVRASLSVRDEVSGVEWPIAQRLWEGEPFRCLGSATRTKKFFIINAKVYSVAVYVEATRCAKELGIRHRGGFFETDDDFCSAIMDGAFSKALLIRLLRDVDGPTFTNALDEALAPRMQLAGETSKLQEFRQAFEKKRLASGTEVALMWNVVGDLEVVVLPPQEGVRSYEGLNPELRIRSISLCRALFETYMGQQSVVAAGRKVWAEGSKKLLESENVNRAARKAH